jgi:hypothetical protein
MKFVKSLQTLFFYDARSKSIYRFVASQVLPPSYTNNQLESTENKHHKPRKYFINIDDSRSKIGKIMAIDSNEKLMCIKTNP